MSEVGDSVPKALRRFEQWDVDYVIGLQTNAVLQRQVALAGPAYALMMPLRRLALAGTELERACMATIRIKLFKIGAAIVRDTRRVRVLMASRHPLKHIFLAADQALSP